MYKYNEPTAEERAMYIGEKLFKLINLPTNMQEPWVSIELPTMQVLTITLLGYMQILILPDGLAVVEKVMIERGYDITEEHQYGSEWTVIIGTSDVAYVASGSKAEAILTAAYKALKSEENNA